ncbi:MAG: biotin--[acetyl-CoA-carboxylase] ligase [Pseudomonadota bacterium]
MSITWYIQEFDEVESTQDLIKQDVRDGAVVMAASQAKGRGRHGREWLSESGNLYFSFCLQPQMSSQNIGQLALVVAVALGQAVQSLLHAPEKMQLKWPNDILIDGKKCAGILIETDLLGDQIDAVYVGIGLNLRTAPPEGEVLSDYAAELPGRAEVLQMILACMSEHYQAWRGGHFSEILSLWLSMAHQKGAPVSVKLGEQLLSGSFEGVDEQGALLIKDAADQSIRTITAGDVYL